MAQQRIQHARSSVAGAVPAAADVKVGELIINMTDRTLRTKNGANALIRLNQHIPVTDAGLVDPQEGDWFLTTAGQIKVYADFGAGFVLNDIAPPEDLSGLLSKAGGVMTGQITLPGGGAGAQAITVTEAAALDTAAVAPALLKAGGTMTGQITLPGGGGATQALQKSEIESLIAAAVPPDLSNVLLKAGGTMTGQITLPGGGSGNQAVSANELAAAVAAHAAQPDPHVAYALTTELDAVITSVALKAPLASPVFTGNPTAPTPAPGDNDFSIATSAFVKAAIDAIPVASSGIVIRRQVFTASGTYTPHTNMLYCTVTATAPGGGSGGCNGNNDYAASGGGGAGATARETFSKAQIGASKAVTIGAPGAAGTSASNGGNGGDTTFGTFLTCVGGFGSVFKNGGSIVGAAGLGGTATGGETNITGGDGHNGFALDALVMMGGHGGDSFWGGGGRASAGTSGGTDGVAGRAYGSGAGGAYSNTVVSAGAVGAPGIVEIIEYCSA